MISVAPRPGPPDSGLVATAPKPIFQVQVRALVEFALRGGDLGGDGRFVGANRAVAGIRGHQRVQRSRPAGYEKEVPFVHDLETEELILRIQGRLDGLSTTPDQVVVEEIKTVQGPWDHQADALHWAQVRCYGFLCAHQRGLEQVTLQLTYLELDHGELTEFQKKLSRSELNEFFTKTTAIYLEWLREQHEWGRRRDHSIRALAFPFPRYRPGQRDLAVAAYRVLARGGRLFLEAPTGVGKTISVLFPAVKALAEGKLERIFYLTARTVGRTVAESALADLRRAGLRLRALTLTAKEKICVQAGHPCDPAACPLARGYYDRLKPALRAALAREEITRPVLEAVSQEHQVCPFELSLDLSVWVDAVVCDYNYVFDPQAYLRRHFEDEPGDCAFLVDEAHNLVDRAREMFSAELEIHDLQTVRRSIRTVVPRCAKALSKLTTTLRKLCGTAESVAEPVETTPAVLELGLFAPAQPSGATPPAPDRPAGTPPLLDEREGVRVSRELPVELLPAVEVVLETSETWLARNEPAEFRESLLELYFRLHSFRRTAGLYDERYATLLERQPAPRVRLFCLDPSFLLRQALNRGKAAIFFSATLAPTDYYRALLGGSPEDGLVQLPSPFPPAHLAVLVQDRIRTQLRARTESLAAVVEAIGTVVRGRTGHYLVYFPSYQYLTAVQQGFQALCPGLTVLVQRPGLSEAEREAFLAAFATEPAESLVGFAVMGGVFGESIDLVGERLIGAIVVGVGLPQLCVERDLIRDYFQAQNGAGFDYAYTFPGMNRVLQAAGRVIRSETDRGVVLLIDGRFAEPRYRRRYPGWWQPVAVRSTGALEEALRRFWSPQPSESGTGSA